MLITERTAKPRITGQFKGVWIHWWHGGFPTHDDVIKWKHFPRYWPFVRGIYRSRWIPHTKASGAEMFSLICVWINGWVNSREAGDLRRHRGHYDVIVMKNASETDSVPMSRRLHESTTDKCRYRNQVQLYIQNCGYSVSIERILVEIDRVITTLHCIWDN